MLEKGEISASGTYEELLPENRKFKKRMGKVEAHGNNDGAEGNTHRLRSESRKRSGPPSDFCTSFVLIS
jgi:hypothetical protein